MVIYIDLVMLLNFILDLMILVAVKITLKRNVSFIRLILGSILGSISILLLFLPLNSFSLFIFKIIISIFMSLIAFKYKSLMYTINNLAYLYMTSTILGGFLYLLNVEFSYQQKGLIFLNNGLSVNFIFIITSAPFFLYFYLKSNKKLKSNYNLYYDVRVAFTKNNFINLVGYLDTGNKLVDPITKKHIILVEEASLENFIQSKNPFYVPVKTVNQSSLIKCYKPLELIINNRSFSNYLIGIIDKKIAIDGIDCLLNNRIMEELNV